MILIINQYNNILFYLMMYIISKILIINQYNNIFILFDDVYNLQFFLK